MSLLQLGRKCLKSLRDAKLQLPAGSPDFHRLDNAINRLLIWAGAIGFFAPGSTGIDRRFKEDEESKEVLAGLLDQLQDSAEILRSDAIQQIAKQQADKNLKSVPEQLKPIQQTSEDDGSSCPPERAAETEHNEEENLDKAIQDIEDTVGLMFRFLNLTRKTSNQPTKARVLEFRSKHVPAEEDAEFESFIRWQIQPSQNASIVDHPGLPGLHENELLTDRVVNAALFRRWKMLYKKRHAEKLAQDQEEAEIKQRMEDEERLKDNSGPNRHGSKVLARNTQKNLRKSMGLKGKPGWVEYSDTEPSVVQRLTVPLMSYKKAHSVVSYTGSARRSRLPIPQAPKAKNDAQEAICPYCWDVIGAEMLGNDDPSRNRWSRHLVRDWSPYICLADECEHAEQQYPTVEDWAAHMRSSHTIVYCCKSPGHEAFMFESAPSLQNHLETFHSDELEPEDILDALEDAALPSMDIWHLLVGYDPSDENHDTPLCRLCGEDVSKVVDNPATRTEALLNHIGYHFESLALQCLHSQNLEDDVGSAKSAAAGMPDHVDRDVKGLPSVRPRSVFYHEAYTTLVQSGTPLEDEIALSDADEWNDWIREQFWYRFPYDADHDRPVQELLQSKDQVAYEEHGITFRWGRFIFNHTQDDGKDLAIALDDSSVQSSRHGVFYHDLVKSWMRDCLQHHDQCRPTHVKQDGSDSPSWTWRLVQIETKPNGELMLRLVNLDELDQRPRYAAISHVSTGNIKGCMLKVSTYQSLVTDGIDLYRLSPMMQEAVGLSVSLGFNYIWLDSMCIIQNSEEDWAHGLRAMSEIFENATITIVPSDYSISNSLWAPSRSFNGLRRMPMDTRGLSSLDNDQPVWTRAWSLQQRLLSRRLIVFKSDRIQWQCKKHHRSNNVLGPYPVDGPRAIFPSDSSFSRASPSRYERWRKLVEHYSGLDLQDNRDKLLAISMIAKKMTASGGDIYLAGIWLDDVATGLCWTSDFFVVTKQRVTAAPTWSWASVDCAVTFQSIKEKWFEVVHCAVPPYDDYDPYSQFKGAELCLEGDLRKFVDFEAFVDDGRMEVAYDTPNSSYSPSSVFFLGTNGEKLYGLLLVPWVALLTTSEDTPYFQRIGVLQCDISGTSFLVSAKKSMVSIR